MDLSVIIPTRERAAKLAACIGCLSRQDLDFERFEVLVGIDGEDDGESRAVAEGAFGHLRAVVYEFPKSGLAAVRNGLIAHAKGRVLLSMNDDVLAEVGFCRAHVEAHAESAHPVTVVGDTPWVVHQPDRMIDRMIRETSMVFFYDQMVGAGRPADYDWGFRHAFGLNVSYPTALVRGAAEGVGGGGYRVFPVTYGYEDVELAFRLKERYGMPVRFRPAARGWHDHRYEARGYLERERLLGRAAWGFAKTAPECARELFGREITGRAEVEYSREYVGRERAGVERARETFLRVAEMPASVVSGPEAGVLVQAMYQQHLPVKRWEWRTGLLEAAAADGM